MFGFSLNVWSQAFTFFFTVSRWLPLFSFSRESNSVLLFMLRHLGRSLESIWRTFQKKEKVTTFSFFWREKKSIFVDLKVFFFALVSEVTWYKQWTCSNFFDNSIRSQDMNFWNLDFSPVQARRFSLFKLLFKQEKCSFSGHFFGKMWLFFLQFSLPWQSNKSRWKTGEKRLSPLQRKPAISLSRFSERSGCSK
jgi:hypothetical protein